MDIRNASSVSMENAIIHVLDTRQNEALCSENELDAKDDEVRSFIQGHILKALGVDSCFRANIISSSAVKDRADSILIADELKEESKYFANRLFLLLKEHEEGPHDLIVCRFKVEDIRVLGFMLLDYKMTYAHRIDMEDGVLNVLLNAKETALPTISQRVNRAAFIWNEGDEMHSVCVDKTFGKTSEHENLFVGRFLNATKLMDYRAKTRATKKVLENWTRKNLQEDFMGALELREALNHAYREEALLKPIDLINGIESLSSRESDDLVLMLDRDGVAANSGFMVDKHFVKKSMKKRSLRTDTGFNISADFELFEGNGYIEIKDNDDGSVDYIIKGVRSVKEK